jgi:Gpi18-like mannosyltransferase
MMSILKSTLRLWLLSAVLLAIFVCAYQPQKQIALDLTIAGNEKFLDHFSAAKDSGRWTESRSGVWLPGLGGGNLPWRVGLRLSGPPRGRFDTPTHVVLRVNNATVAEFDARNQEQDYECEIGRWQLGLNGDLRLEIDSSTVTPSPDEHELGVRITRVWLARSDGIAFPSLRGFLLMLALVGCCGVLLRVSLASASGMRMSQFVDPFENKLSWLLVAVLLAVAFGHALNLPQAAWWLQIVTVSLMLVTGMTWLVGRIVAGSLTRYESLRLLIVFALAALVRIALDFGRGYEGDIASYGRQGDIATYIALSWKTVGHGIHSAYLEINGSPPSDNPPVLLYSFWFLGWLYQRLISPLFGHTQLGDPVMLRFMLRLPCLIADLLAGALIFRVLQKRPSASFNASLFATGMYLLNPALIFDSAYWGQTAAVHSLFMLLSVIAVDRRRYHWAGAALAVAILTKPQAIAIAPLVLILAVGERGLLRFVAGGVIATLLVITPFILAGNSASIVEQYAQTTRYHPFLAPNAHNFWWFVTGGRGWVADVKQLGPVSFRAAGLLLFAAATLLSAILVWRDRRLLFVAAAYQSLAFFMLNTQIHENHLLPMFAPLLIAAVITDRRFWWYYGGFVLTSVANMTLHDPQLFAWLGYPNDEIYGGPALAFPRWINAAAQTALFVAFTVWLAIFLAREFRLKLARVEE